MGESVSEGTVLEWHKGEGDFVEEGETIVEVSTDKVDAEVPATASGTVTKLLVEVDDVVKVGQALAAGIWACEAVDIRAFGIGRHGQVDDTPAGGGPGMVLRADVLAAAIDAARTGNPQAPALYLSPRGEPLRQPLVRELAAGPGVLLVAGRFEGIDERVVDGGGQVVHGGRDPLHARGDQGAVLLVDGALHELDAALEAVGGGGRDLARAGVRGAAAGEARGGDGGQQGEGEDRRAHPH